MFPAAESGLVIRIVGSKTVGREGENRFVFEVFDESTTVYLSKHFAYCTPVVGSQMHRQRGFRVRMNDKTDYPQILEGDRRSPTAQEGTAQILNAAVIRVTVLAPTNKVLPIPSGEGERRLDCGQKFGQRKLATPLNP